MKDARNYAVYRWTRTGNHWLLPKRYSILNEAVEHAKRINGIIVDISPGRMIFQKGIFCDRKLPIGIKSLPPIEKFEL